MNKEKIIHLAKEDTKDQRKIIIIMEKAPLQIGRVKRDQVLLNGDDHANYISKKLKRDPAEYRPDIAHQCLLTLLDSPLNKAGKLEVYVTTTLNQVIHINSHTRIPRTYKRFAALMVQLLKKLKIRAQQTSETLLKVIESPVKKHLPPQCIKIATSTKGRLVNMFEYAKQLDKGQPIVFVVGAVAKGNPTMQVDYIHESICVSKYSLSASNCLMRILSSFEQIWGIN